MLLVWLLKLVLCCVVLFHPFVPKSVSVHTPMFPRVSASTLQKEQIFLDRRSTLLTYGGSDKIAGWSDLSKKQNM